MVENLPPAICNFQFSIVIPTHNRPKLLRACLASVVRHAPVNTEIIVVDDGSANGAASETAGEFTGVEILRFARPQGFCAAANAGIKAARRAVVELLNDDAEVTPGWAEAALARFRDPQVAAVAPLVLCSTPQSSHRPRIDSAGDGYYWGGVAAKRGHGQFLGPEFLYPCRVFGASASAAFYRRQVVLQLDGFPEEFGAYFEDVDLAFRINRAGFQVVYEPESRVFHQGSASYGKPNRRLLARQSQNEERVFWRNLPGWLLTQALPAHLAVLAAKSWRRWREGTFASFLCGRLRVLGELPNLARHRRHLHMIAPASDLDNWPVEKHFWGNPWSSRKR